MRGKIKRKRRGTSFILILGLAVAATAGAIAVERLDKRAALEYIASYETAAETPKNAAEAIIDIAEAAETASSEAGSFAAGAPAGTGTSADASDEAAGTGSSGSGIETGTSTDAESESTKTDISGAGAEEQINEGDGEKKEGFFIEDGGRYYYLNGEKLTGLREIDGKTYYFSKETGRMLTGSFKADGSWRYFDMATGEMAKGFVKIGGNTYYYAKNTGKKLYGIRRLGDNVYTFDKKGRLVRTVYGSRKAICLTFDDGPSDSTPKILAALRENDGLATFFVVGSRLKAYSKTMKETSDMGCEIANHSYSHPSFYSLSGEGITNEMKKTNRRILKFTGKKAEICRTPGGAIGGVINDAVGMPIVLWSVDTLDWKTRNADSTYNSVMKSARDGSVVLMHDLYPQTADAAVRMIPALKKAGYQLVTVKEMSLLKKKPLKDGKVYFGF